MRRSLLVVLALLSPATDSLAEPSSRPAVPAPRAEYRFDALRVDGRLHGPEALTVRSMTGARSAPLMRRRRSFLHRVFETLEDACLHGADH